MPRQVRSRNFCFTYHSQDDVIDLTKCEENILTLPCKYLIYQHEKCPDTGRIHLQGFCTFDDKQTFTGIHEYCPGIWVKEAKASAFRNIAYCSKLDTRVAGPYEHGDRPCQGYRSDLVMMGEMIKAGLRPEEVVKEQGMGAARVYKHLQVYASCLVSRPRDFVPRVFIRYGEPGSGKTRWCYDNYTSVYPLTYKKDAIWWDGYCNQGCILLDDWPLIADESLYNQLLVWCDRYPCMVQVKGGMVNLGLSDIVITSNDPPTTWFGGRGLRALARRVTSIEQVMIEGGC